MLPDIQPGNTKILYFFNCLLDGMHTKFIEFCDFVLRDFDHRNFAFVSAALAGRKKLQWRF